MEHVDLHEAQRQLPALLPAVIRGRELIITQNNQAVAKLVQVNENNGDLQLGSAKELVIIHDDFAEPLEDFQEYM
jgi:antitoxin (DNA-binding transcriptional repressor) of toxin-antitoxin stability system